MAKTQRFLVLITAHQGGAPLAQAKPLGRAIEGIYQRNFGPDTKVTCLWAEIPRGKAYLAGRPSTATTVLAPVPDTITEPAREAHMRDMCELFIDRTGCNINEIIVTAMNVSDAKRYARKSRQRFDPAKVRRTGARVAARTLVDAAKLGYLRTSLTLPELD